MSRAPFHPHIPRRTPKLAEAVTLSQVRAAADARGLALAIEDMILIRDGETVLHQPNSLTEAMAWLDCRA
jgi:hypothetical protein